MRYSLLLLIAIGAGVGAAMYMRSAKRHAALPAAATCVNDSAEGARSPTPAAVQPAAAVDESVKPAAKPAAKPAEKPSVKPSAKPSVKPSVKSDAKPADKPTVREPVSAPAVAKSSASASAAKPSVGGWRGLEAGNWSAGRRLNASALAKKVVFCYVWDSSVPESVAQLPRIEEIWNGFKSKPFVVLASHRGTDREAARKALKGAKATFSAYEGVAHEKEPPALRSLPYIYVLDHRGKMVYRGHSHQDATESLVTAITTAVLSKR